MATRSNSPPKPHLGLGTRIRKSPFFESTLAWGCKEYTTYNHEEHETLNNEDKVIINKMKS